MDKLLVDENPQLWPPDGDRPRQWGAAILGPAGAPDTRVVVRHYAILAPGEDLTEYPPTVEMLWPEWVERCAEFGLTAAGQLA